MQTFLFTLLIIGLCVIGLSLRILLVKGGEFRGTCATNNPMLRNRIGECEVCGRQPGEDCQGEPSPVRVRS